jgi:hypothetical protein
MTDLYVQKPMHSEEEERHYTELAIRLIDLVDASTRSIVADKIARYPNAPAAVRRASFAGACCRRPVPTQPPTRLPAAR